MLHIIMNVIGITSFIGVYAYALSTEPFPSRSVRLRPPPVKADAFTPALYGSTKFHMAP